MTQGDLVLSMHAGRYAIGDAQYGPDLSGGVRVAVLVAGTWVKGRVEHGSHPSVGAYAIERHGTNQPAYGYFVLIDGGGVLGLCSGMEVRLLDSGE